MKKINFSPVVKQIKIDYNILKNRCDLYCPDTDEKITFTNKGYCLIEKNNKIFAKYEDGTIEEVFVSEKIGELCDGSVIYHLKLPKTKHGRKDNV